MKSVSQRRANAWYKHLFKTQPIEPIPIDGATRQFSVPLSSTSRRLRTPVRRTARKPFSSQSARLQTLGARTVAAIVGFGLAWTVLFDRFSPFAAALVAVLPGTVALWAGIGALVGFVAHTSAGVFLRYVGAFLLIAATKWLFAFSPRLSKSPGFFPLTVAFSLLATGVAIAVPIGLTVVDVLLALAEAALGGCAAFFFDRAYSVVTDRVSPSDYAGFQIAGVLSVLGLLLVALLPFNIGPFSIGRALAMLAVLLLSQNGGHNRATVCGMTLGFLFLLADSSLTVLALLLGFGGLLAGTLSLYGRAGSAVGLLGVTVFVLLVSDNAASLPTVMVDSCVACAVFLLLPTAWAQKMSFARTRNTDALSYLKQTCTTRLQLLSDALCDIGDTTTRVTERLDRRRANTLTGVWGDSCRRVCSDCGLRDSCWGDKQRETAQALADLLPTLRQKGEIDTLPTPLQNRCCRSRELISALNLAYTEHTARSAARRRVGVMRHLVSGQFSAMSAVLAGLSEDIAALPAVNAEITRKVRGELKTLGLTLRYCHVFEDEEERMTVDFCVERVERESIPDDFLCDRLAILTGHTFAPPLCTTVRDRVRYVFCEPAVFRVQHAVRQIPHDTSKISGDTCAVFTDAHGYCNLLLSDGMGKGKPAAVDSAMTVTLLSRLIEAGFDYRNAVKMTGAALMAKSDDESLSTVDAARLDLYTGALTLYKAGAPLTIVVRDGHPSVVEKTAAPIGIVDPVEPAETKLYLGAGDTVLMMSDGVSDNGVEFIFDLLRREQDATVDQLAEHILDACITREQGVRDDLSVIAVRLEAFL